MKDKFYRPKNWWQFVGGLCVLVVLLLFFASFVVGIGQAIDQARGPRGRVDAQAEFIKACVNSKNANGQGGVPDTHSEHWTCVKPH